MTPRALRNAITEGRMTCIADIPDPPKGLPEWRHERFKVAIRCAVLFLQGKVWHEIVSQLGRDGFDVRRGITRSRVNQYVTKGVEYLLEQGVYEEVRKRRGSN